MHISRRQFAACAPLLLAGCSGSLRSGSRARPVAPVHLPASENRRSDRVLVNGVTGAVVDESSLRVTIDVDASGRTPSSMPTIAAGLERAAQHLAEGVPTRVRIHSGVYRETAEHVRLDAPGVRDTLLVIEAAGDGAVVWTGADAFTTGWKDEGDGLYSHAWDHELGLYVDPWGVAHGVGPRREVATLDGRLLKPIALERYTARGLKDFPEPDQKVTFTYEATLDPREALAEGTFGVVERGKSKRLYVRLGPDEKPEGVEVSVRRRLLDIHGKRGLVLRGLTIQQCANSQNELGQDVPLFIGWQDERAVTDVLIDRCTFRFHAGVALSVKGTRWTLRDSHFDYNGYSGIAGDNAQNVVFENCTTNFNCWREYFAGVEDWCYAGFKMAGLRGHLVRNHCSVGNADHGMWWDIFCADVTVDGALCLYNRRSFIYELSFGPFHARRILAVHGFRRPSKGGSMEPVACISCASRATIESSIIYTNTSPDLVGAQWYERDNEHARRHRLLADLYELKNSVVLGGPRTKSLLRTDNVGDRKQPSYLAFRYRGRGNVYFHLGGKKNVFGYTDEGYQRHEVDLAAWTERGDEIEASFADPGFVDAENLDFRAAVGSPLAGRSDLPLLRVDPLLVRAAKDYLAWLGWNAEEP